MPATFFAPNPKKTGGILNASFNSKDGSIYFKLVQQTDWNAAEKTGVFKNGKVINIKFSQDEAGSFIAAIRNKGKATFFHSFGDESCSGSLTYYFVEASGREGFGFSVKKDGIEIKVGLSLGAAERLMEYLRFAFDHIFSAIYAADKKEFADRAKKEQAPDNSEAEPTEEQSENDLPDF